MTDTTAAPDGAPSISLYRAIWRWHFFAGLLVIPFMLNLAITGGLYLFKDEINHSFFAYRYVVPSGPTTLKPSELVAKATAAVPGSTASAYRGPAVDTDSALVTVGSDAGSTLVFLDPHNGAVLDKVGAKEEFNWVVKKIHSLDYFGWFANRIIEMVGGFAIILVVTGFYLWWPRKQTGGVLSVRGTPSRRVFWRDLHAVTGAVAGLLILFLAVTGMPWSGYWGGKLNSIISDAGIGYPAELWDAVPVSTVPTSDVLAKAGWTVENAPVPESTPPANPLPIGIDKAIEIATTAGITPGFELALPSDPTGVYTAAIFPDDLSLERTIHIDQYSGKPLVDVHFTDYGSGGKAIEFGINVHQGQEWGLVNQLAMLVTCLAILLSSISAVVMWWKRRPVGRLGVPPLPPARQVYLVLWLVAISVGLLFPITGIAILIMVAVDLIIIRSFPPIRQFFS